MKKHADKTEASGSRPEWPTFFLALLCPLTILGDAFLA